jgi:hypothetical protein
MSWKPSNKNWVKKIIWPFRRFYQRVKRLIEFIPIVWKGADWDYRYAIDLFKFQLLRTADYIERHNRYVHNENDVDRIRLVCRLMTKVYDEEYATEYQDILEKMYGENVLNCKFEKIEGTDSSRMFWEYESWENAKDIEKTKDALFEISRERQERAHRLLWQLIEKDIRRWWD